MRHKMLWHNSLLDAICEGVLDWARSSGINSYAKFNFRGQTRCAFHKIHLEHLEDDHVAKRHSVIIEPLSMGLPAEFLLMPDALT